MRFPIVSFASIFLLLSSSELDKAVEHKNLNGTISIRGDKDNERKKVTVGSIKLLLLACCTHIIPNKQR